MELQEITELFMQNLLATTWLEVIAVLTGLLSVWYCRLENILVYPIGIVSVLIYVYICHGAGLYADMGINVVYFIMSVYGWYSWTHKPKEEEPIQISVLTRKQQLLSIGFIVSSYILLYFVLHHYTDSNVPHIDAFTTSVFIVAMYLQARKKVESWLLWIIGDIVSIPLYFYKGLIFTSFQFSVFLILAIMGYIEWRRSHIESQRLHA